VQHVPKAAYRSDFRENTNKTKGRGEDITEGREGEEMERKGKEVRVVGGLLLRDGDGKGRRGEGKERGRGGKKQGRGGACPTLKNRSCASVKTEHYPALYRRDKPAM